MTPIEALKKINAKIVFSNLQDKRQKRVPKYKIGNLNRNADFEKVSVGAIQQTTATNYMQ